MATSWERFHVSSKALIVRDNKVLLIKYDDENGVHYNFPGGKMKPHETAHQTLIRKVREEAGGVVEKVGPIAFIYEYIGANHNFIAGDKHSVSLIFWAHLKEGNQPDMSKAIDPDPIQIDVCWVPVKDFQHIDLYPRVNSKVVDLISKGEQENGIYWGDIL